jgi:hypothetical protein
MKTVETVKPIGGNFAGCCRFEAFSFGSIRIDGVTYEHDVLIDRGRSASVRRSPQRNSGRLSVTRRFRRRKRSRGNAGG